MKKEVRNLLIRKRYVELECLGIPAQLYYNAIKLIERHVYVVIKGVSIYIFKKDDFSLHTDMRDKSKYFDSDKIMLLLMETFGVDKTLAYNIYAEWIREKVINCKMTENSTKYWDFLSLPSVYIDLDETEYNF